MNPPRFLLILSVHSNLLRAALVTRDLKIVSSAQQTFNIADDEFDPAEVWYKTKKVIAACLDIGRTPARDIAGIAFVTPEMERVEWEIENQEIVARGKMAEKPPSVQRQASNAMFSGGMSAWLLWNLTGALQMSDAGDFPKTRVRAPFDAEIPIVLRMRAKDARAEWLDENVLETDRAILGTARRAWKMVN